MENSNSRNCCYFFPIYLQQTLFKPIAPTLKKIVSGGIVLQSSTHSCMAATASNITRQFDIIKSEKEMANLFGTTKFDTSASGFIKGIEYIGFTCENVFFEDRDLSIVYSIYRQREKYTNNTEISIEY